MDNCIFCKIPHHEIGGKVLYEDQKFDIGFDPADIYRRANEIIRRMK